MRVFICILSVACLAAALVAVRGAPAWAEGVLTQGELRTTWGGCCDTTKSDTTTCSQGGWPCYSCLSPGGACGLKKQMSGNTFFYCVGDNPQNTCTFAGNVNCYRLFQCVDALLPRYICQTPGLNCASGGYFDSCHVCPAGDPLGPWKTKPSWVCVSGGG